MRAVVQRVAEAAVRVEGRPVGAIGAGLLVLLGVGRGDGEKDADDLAEKIAHLRVFPDDEGRMNRSVHETGGSVLVVPQFTLYGDASKGNRPGFSQAAPPEAAEPLYEEFVRRLKDISGITVETGSFGAAMEVELVNDGPVTILIEK